MVPPKKDAFSDLFNYAHGGLLKSSPSTSLNDLSQKLMAQAQPSPKINDSWGNLDLLSPSSGLSPAGSKPHTPVNATARGNGGFSYSSATFAVENDPFAVFEAKNASTGHKGDIHDSNVDPFDFFESNSGSSSLKLPNQGKNTEPFGGSLGSTLNNQSIKEAALLDDDFTDAFTLETPEPAQSEHVSKTQTVESLRNPATEESSERDHVLAALMAEGFPINIANKAINRVGPDFEKCRRLIVMSSVRSETRSPHHKQTPPTKEIGGTLQDISSEFVKKASWFLDKSKKTVIKNINNFQNQRSHRDGNDMPAWISSQHKYKDQAMERKKDGGTYEDYGTDEDNINAEEIRRIVQAQREKEIERQRQRLEAMGRKNNSKTMRSPDKDNIIGPEMRTATGSRSRQSSPKTPEVSVSSGQVLSSDKSTSPKKSPVITPEEDLLGLGSALTLIPALDLSRARQFKQTAQEEQSYISPSRRKQANLALQSTQRPATSEPLNTFSQSDYETHKAKGAEAFSSGNYDQALNAYTKCLQSLPEKHELRIVITANLALTAIKIGNYRLASQHCEQGLALVGDHFADATWLIHDKNIKYWYVRLLARKAESLEMLENFEASLECYMILITKLGVNDKKTMDAKRRVNNIVNPPTQQPKAAPKPSVSSQKARATRNLSQVKSRHLEEQRQEEKKFQLHDAVHERVQKWSHGKEDNLRSLLMSLSDVLPERLGFSFITDKKITINDLMLTKKVKINYMKVISNIHPDKLGGYELEDQMICQAVFVALNKAWDEFKKQNNIA